jgi:hypothetical protein
MASWAGTCKYAIEIVLFHTYATVFYAANIHQMAVSFCDISHKTCEELTRQTGVKHSSCCVPFRLRFLWLIR